MYSKRFFLNKCLLHLLFFKVCVTHLSHFFVPFIFHVRSWGFLNPDSFSHSDREANPVKKTEPRTRLVLPSKLPIGGLKFIEKQIFYPCPFLWLADFWFSYAKIEAKWCVDREISSFKLPAFAKKCYQLILKNINSSQRVQKYFILQFNPKLLAKFEL